MKKIISFSTIFLGLFLFAFAMLLIPNTAYAQVRTWTSCSSNSGYCSSSYYPPPGSRPQTDNWAYSCKDYTNPPQSLQPQYCYFGNAGVGGANTCGHYFDNFGGAAGCMNAVIQDTNTGALINFWPGSMCPPGYNELTPRSVGVSAFFDCLNLAGGRGGIGGSTEPCCIRSGSPQTCNNQTGGFCESGFGCGQDYTLAADGYECPSTTGGGCCRPLSCGDVGGTCAPSSGTGTCRAGTTSSYVDTAVNATCSTECCTAIQTCNGGGTACVGTPPANTCNSTSGSSTLTTYTNCGNGYTCSPSGTCNRTNVFCSVPAPNNCSAGFAPSGPLGGGCVCVTNINIHVFTDYNHNGSINTPDAGKAGVTVTDNGGNFPQTDASGNIVFSAKATGTYTFTMTVPANFQATTPNPQAFTQGTGNPNATVNFGLSPLYNISGRVFSDRDKSGTYNAGESGIGGGTVTVSGGPTTVGNITVAGDGTWTTPTTLLSGTYTVTYTTSLPAGYAYTTSNSYAVTVGDPAGSPVCNKGGANDGVCGGTNNGSLSGINFGMSNEQAHYGAVCLDIRTDNSGGATISDPFPAPGATCGGANGSQAIITNGTCSTGSGIVFSCSGTFDFGLGSADSNNWTVGGANQDSECYSGGGLDVIPTSYDYLTTTARESNIIPTNLDTFANPDPTTSCDTTNCVLPPTLPKGIYQVNGDLTLSSATYTFPAPADPTTTSSGYIILVNGNLHIQGNILVPKGSAVVFSVSGSIDVAAGVGNTITDPTSSLVNTPNLEGVYSSDHSFTVLSNTTVGNVCNADGTPLDKRLYILGVVVTNAGKGGGSFINNRDLCIYDTSCSAVEVGDGLGSNEGLLLNYLLTLIADGKFVNNKNYNWQEVRP